MLQSFQLWSQWTRVSVCGVGDATVKGLLSGLHSGTWLGHCWQRLLHFPNRVGQCCCGWKVRREEERGRAFSAYSSPSLWEGNWLLMTRLVPWTMPLPWPWLLRHKHTGGGHRKRHLKYNFQCSCVHTPIIFSLLYKWSRFETQRQKNSFIWSTTRLDSRKCGERSTSLILNTRYNCPGYTSEKYFKAFVSKQKQAPLIYCNSNQNNIEMTKHMLNQSSRKSYN